MFREFPDVVNVNQLMKMLGIGRNKAYGLLKDNLIQSVRIGKVHRIPKTNVIKYMKSTKKSH